MRCNTCGVQVKRMKRHRRTKRHRAVKLALDKDTIGIGIGIHENPRQAIKDYHKWLQPRVKRNYIDTKPLYNDVLCLIESFVPYTEPEIDYNERTLIKRIKFNCYMGILSNQYDAFVRFFKGVVPFRNAIVAPHLRTPLMNSLSLILDD